MEIPVLMSPELKMFIYFSVRIICLSVYIYMHVVQIIPLIILQNNTLVVLPVLHGEVCEKMMFHFVVLFIQVSFIDVCDDELVIY